MLPAQHRLTRSADFRRCVRHGARGGSTTVVAHVLIPDLPSPQHEEARAGLVVSKAVGNAVVRNRVARRLRHLAGDRLAELPQGSLLVLRALPGAGAADSAQLAADLEAAVRTARRRGSRPSGSAAGSARMATGAS